jgi:hypothetical protein
VATVTGNDPSGRYAFTRLTNAGWTVATGDGLVGGTYSVAASADGLFVLTTVGAEPRLFKMLPLQLVPMVLQPVVVLFTYSKQNSTYLSILANSFSLGYNQSNTSGVFSCSNRIMGEGFYLEYRSCSNSF